MFKPKYKIQVEQQLGGNAHYCFYIWKGFMFPDLVASGYGFKTAVEAAQKATDVRDDLQLAWKVSR